MRGCWSISSVLHDQAYSLGRGRAPGIKTMKFSTAGTSHLFRAFDAKAEVTFCELTKRQQSGKPTS
jgi:hypothetical protein